MDITHSRFFYEKEKTTGIARGRRNSQIEPEKLLFQGAVTRHAKSARNKGLRLCHIACLLFYIL